MYNERLTRRRSKHAVFLETARSVTLFSACGEEPEIRVQKMARGVLPVGVEQTESNPAVEDSDDYEDGCLLGF
jgi:hypothetical protein